jgi:hypothetical protein
MGTKLIVDRSCPPKTISGDGDPAKGTLAILDLLDSRGRAEDILAECAAKGLSPDATRVEIVVGVGATARKEVLTVTALQARAKPLDALESDCEGCPARVHEEAFGCFTYAEYPIPRAIEEWLMNLLRPATELGGIVWREATRDFGWSGERITALRSVGWFSQSKEPIVRDLGGGVTVSSDAILEAILALGTLSPTHSAILLVCFGAVLLDGQPLTGTDKTALGPLLGVPVAERAARTKLVLPPSPPEGTQGEEYLSSLYRAWVTGHANSRPPHCERGALPAELLPRLFCRNGGRIYAHGLRSQAFTGSR